MKTRFSLATALLVLPLLAAAQNPIYQSTDKSGPVFSDTPSPGATPVDLQPINVIQTPRIAPATGSPDPAPAAYDRLLITAPASDSTIWVNSGTVPVQVFLQPPLNSTLGDTLQVRVNGNLLPRTFTGNTISIPSSDFVTSADTDNIEQSLQVAVVATSGKVLIESPPVRLYLRRHIQYNRATPR